MLLILLMYKHVKNLYVTVYEPLYRNRDCYWERQLCSKVGIHIVLCLLVWNRHLKALQNIIW